jgi:hypothetical protein
MRKLAREATIFALLGMLAAAVGSFALLAKDIRTRARLAGAQAVHAQILLPGATVAPIDTVEVPLTNGTVLHIRQCDPEFIPENPPSWLAPVRPSDLPAGVVPLAPYDCRYFHLSNPDSVSVPLGEQNQVAIEKDYWGA